MTIEDVIAEYFAARNRVTVGRFLRFQVRSYSNDNLRRGHLPATDGSASFPERSRHLTTEGL